MTHSCITDLVVAVMVGNEGALRFYRRRGLVPTEVYLWRITDPIPRPSRP